MEDRELAQYRDLMKAPPESGARVSGQGDDRGVFVGAIMTPASMYMQLVVGGDIGPAAQWVTIILFIEVARRGVHVLRGRKFRALLHGGGVLVSTRRDGLLWNQFIVQSESFRRRHRRAVPSWVAPRRRACWRSVVLPPGVVRADRADRAGAAAGSASTISAWLRDVPPDQRRGEAACSDGAGRGAGRDGLADASKGAGHLAVAVFSFGAMLGMAFGAIYWRCRRSAARFCPSRWRSSRSRFRISRATSRTFLRPCRSMIAFRPGLLISGMVLPFWAMVGSFDRAVRRAIVDEPDPVPRRL
jgi:hypothetical protein